MGFPAFKQVCHLFSPRSHLSFFEHKIKSHRNAKEKQTEPFVCENPAPPNLPRYIDNPVYFCLDPIRVFQAVGASMQNLTDKLALVTGASQGIGKAIAMSLAQAGCRVVLLASRPGPLKEAVDEIIAKGGKAFGFSCNLRDTQAFLETLRQVVEQLGPVDILVNNVGGGTFKPMEQHNVNDVVLPFEMPLTIAAVASWAVIPSMQKRGEGHIINLTSPAGYFPLPFMMPYTAARFGMVGLSLSLFEELHDQGIGVTLICPAEVDTGYFERNDADLDWYPKIAKIFPVLQPAQVGEKVVWAIKNDCREVIFPWMLWSFVRFYQTLPWLALPLLKALGLFSPTKKR